MTITAISLSVPVHTTAFHQECDYNIKLRTFITNCNHGIEINNNAVVTELELKNVTATNNKMGMRARGSLDGLKITNSPDGNTHGLQSVAGENKTNTLAMLISLIPHSTIT